MRLPAGPTIATAIAQLFFAASANAGAAAFLAFSRLMGNPYGFGICPTALPSAPSTTNKTTNIFTKLFRNMFSPPQIQLVTAFASQRALEHLETFRQSFSLTCFPPHTQNCQRRSYRPLPYTWQSAETDKAAGSSSRLLQGRRFRTLSLRSRLAQFPSPPIVPAPAPRCAARPSLPGRPAQKSPVRDHRCSAAFPAPCTAARTPPSLARASCLAHRCNS